MTIVHFVPRVGHLEEKAEFGFLCTVGHRILLNLMIRRLIAHTIHPRFLRPRPVSHLPPTYSCELEADPAWCYVAPFTQVDLLCM